jgi:hypothetical protein
MHVRLAKMILAVGSLQGAYGEERASLASKSPIRTDANGGNSGSGEHITNNIPMHMDSGDRS